MRLSDKIRSEFVTHLRAFCIEFTRQSVSTRSQHSIHSIHSVCERTPRVVDVLHVSLSRDFTAIPYTKCWKKLENSDVLCHNDVIQCQLFVIFVTAVSIKVFEKLWSYFTSRTCQVDRRFWWVLLIFQQSFLLFLLALECVYRVRY